MDDAKVKEWLEKRSWSGYGDGSGYGSGSVSGYGYGSRYGVSSYCGSSVYTVDNVNTIFYRIIGNLAKCAILNQDLTLTPCYVVRDGNGLFAHGETPKEAQDALTEKMLENLDTDKDIEMMLSELSLTEQYPASVFYKWHHILTGSCEMGRKSFMRNHGIGMDDMYTVSEFVDITGNDYGGDIIKRLADRINKNPNKETKQT